MFGQYTSLGVLMPESGSIRVRWLTSVVPDASLLKEKAAAAVCPT